MRLVLRRIHQRLLLMGLCLCLVCSVDGRAVPKESFQQFLAGVKTDAVAAGIHPKTIDHAFKHLKKPNKKIIKLDQNQAEFKANFETYYKQRGAANLPKGIINAKKFQKILAQIEKKFKVDPAYVLALWGIESRYGAYTGRVPVIQALATLAYDGRRYTFFRNELLAALQILHEGHVRLEAMNGSWAGAMGHCQFMPSSFLAYAYDADQDGKKDIWHSATDALFSIANYLQGNSWVHHGSWGVEVTLRKAIPAKLFDTKVTRPVFFWKNAGVQIQGKKMPPLDTPASLIEVLGKKSGEKRFFLVYDNFKNILKWNRSYLFALTVGHLADSINGNGSK